VVAPLGLAVVFAMLASYGFSRTLTPIAIGILLKGERHGSLSAGKLHGNFPALGGLGQGIAAIADMHDDEDMSSEIVGQGGSNRLLRIETAG
jgi:multidrug efflux pump subunit AcrB